MSILPFENPVVKLRIAGTTLREALEHGVSRVGLSKGDGRFPQISGMRFTYDAKKPLGSRIVEATVNGKLLDDSATYTVATTAFVLSGGDGYSMFKGQPFVVKPEEGRAETVILLDALAKADPIAPRVDGRIKRIDN
jgi:5'-nucleotidase